MDPAHPLPAYGLSLIRPVGGRLFWRHRPDGQILLGLLHLPEDADIVPGRGYLAIEQDGRLELSRQALDVALPKRMGITEIGGLIQAPIWPRTRAAGTLVVRFMETFPEANAWTVYGVSCHAADPQASPCRWADVGADGTLRAIDEPASTRGMAIAQVLTDLPVWPHPDGTAYSLPKTRPQWREHQHQAHLLMAQAGREPHRAAEIQAALRSRPALQELWPGRLDMDYCQFLAHMEARSGLDVERPLTAEQWHARQALARECVQAMSEKDSPATARPPRP